ncbi:MAG TPA: hypothetical protein DD400_05965, partial [Rhodospirillaceae bacterium]|nr:hypothetical protein [Rhodospirillaceae bacterium]
MINGRQIRAARALVDMSQDELAEAAGLTPQAIRKIESNKVTPREGTISDIMKVFRNHRIEFIDNQGVRFIPEDVEVLNGKEGIRRFFDLVFEHAQTSGGTIRQNGIGDKTFFDCAPEETAEQGARMAILVPKRKNIYVRAILANGNMDFMYSQYAD